MAKLKILILERDKSLLRSYSLGIEIFFNKRDYDYELNLIDKSEKIKEGYGIYFIDLSYCKEIENFRRDTKKDNNYFVLLGEPYSEKMKEISKKYDEVISKENIVKSLERLLK